MFHSKSILVIAGLSVFFSACGNLLPHGDAVTDSPWQSFQDAQKTFDLIVPYQTTIEDLKRLKLDPESNANITILNYSDVVRRFIPGASVSLSDLDTGVQECIAAKTACKGYEIDQKSTTRIRFGNFWADFLNFKRKVNVAGWRFNGVLLVMDGKVIYKLTGGQPIIHEVEQSNNPLGPLQSFGESNLINH
ncbi:MAG: hypothetical protein WC073_16720 [Sterolibacterium sp.]